MEEERFDTWTRTELLTARGYDMSPEVSPVPTTNGSATSQNGTSALSTPEALAETANGSATRTTDEPGTAGVPVATNGSESSQSGPEALSSPEVLPEATETTNGVAKSHTALQGQTGRSCSECEGPLPASHQSGAERLTCSPRCAQLRHNRLRHNRLREPKENPQMKALQLATGPAPVEVGTASAVSGPSLPTANGHAPNGHTSVPEASVLEAVVHVSELLPVGWHAELGPGSVTLSWCAG